MSRPLPHVKCPQCRKKGPWFEDKWGPFCSERCRLLDLGRWFNEEHVVSEPLRPEMFDDYTELPPELDPDRPE